MTSYGTYNAGLACKNPSCKSYGRPHPNCKCYGDMAEGGEVKHFCQEERAHQRECEYFDEGGIVDDQQAIPDEQAPDPSSYEKPLDSSQPIPDEDVPDTWEEPSKYSSTSQKIGTALEGFAQGVGGPIATAAELGLSALGVPNLTQEDIAGREKENPGLHGLAEAAGFAGSMYTGIGEIGLMGKAAVATSKALKLEEATSATAKIGSSVLKGAIQSGLLQGSDNVSKALLGQGNPSDTVGAVLSNGMTSSLLLGGVLGGVAGTLNEIQLGTKLSTWLAGIGQAASGIQKENSLVREASPKMWDAGAKFWKNNFAVTGAGAAGLAAFDIKQGIENDDISGGLVHAAKDFAAITGAGWVIGKAAPYIGAALLKGAVNWEGSPRSIFQLMNFGKQAANGHQIMQKGIDTLFEGGGQQLYKTLSNNKDLDDWVKEGGVTQEIQDSQVEQSMGPQLEVQGYAEGGNVEKQASKGIFQNDAVSTTYPTENILLNAAKGRIYQYLNGLRPQKNQPKLAFDEEPDQKQKKKTYDRALTIANRPMSILEEIKKGTIEPEHIQHFNTLYPELNNVLQQKLTEKISSQQMKGKKPNFIVRQGLSLLMGTPLSSEFIPRNIQIAQMAAQGQQQQAPQQQAQPASKNKKPSSSFTKAPNAFLTSNQALTGRHQRQS